MDDAKTNQTENSASHDPLAAFLSDPGSHLADILYLNFRIYKKQLLWRFFETVLNEIQPRADQVIHMADIGASMGHDAHFLLNKLTQGFQQKPSWGRTSVHLIEGDNGLLTRGREFWRGTETKMPLDWEFIQAALVEPLPLASNSQDLVICSEVVEHLKAPQILFDEMHRVLKPGKFLIFTTDNSPSFLQRVRRVPVWLKGEYKQKYTRPDASQELAGKAHIHGKDYEIYGHINLNPTRVWERMACNAGFKIHSFGTYESIRRGGGSKSPAALAFYFAMGFLVAMLPRRLGRFVGDTTALLLRKP